ncbi:MAG: lamin tail domain-containing protein, partial [Planctomycetota bacterium]|nr:lamin tail domain-containing protein [Planctomycetota bacterium]
MRELGKVLLLAGFCLVCVLAHRWYRRPAAEPIEPSELTAQTGPRPTARGRRPTVAEVPVRSGRSGKRSRLVLNELLAANRSTNLDDRGKSSDWVELYHTGSSSENLEGYTLTDDPAAPAKWTFPAVVVSPGDHLLVWLAGDERASRRQSTAERRASGRSTDAFRPRFIRAGAMWRYLVGAVSDEGPPRGWRQVEFNDRSFAVGPSGFGFGDRDDRTLLPDGTTSVFLRKVFVVSDLEATARLVLRIDYDDGFVAYLNGFRVAEANSPRADPDFQGAATGRHEAGRPEYFDLSGARDRLRRGRNVLAVVGLNALPSEDMSLVPELGVFTGRLSANFRLKRSGEALSLFDASGRLVDSVKFPAQEVDQSYGRSTDGARTWVYFPIPTPESRNGGPAFPRPLDTRLSFLPPPGRYDSGVRVRIATDVEGVRIRYTLNG